MRGINMERMETGMFAKARAGHDAGRFYVIIGIDREYVYLADGRLKTVEKPKKKKVKHVQVICCQKLEAGSQTIDNETVKKALDGYRKTLVNKKDCESE